MRPRRALRLAVVATALAAADCPAIEMFTYFGDGSRIGLPSLEVPVEAYPGIPLRSDRIRARRRAAQAKTAHRRTAAASSITLRAQPAAPMSGPEAPAPIPVAPEPR